MEFQKDLGEFVSIYSQAGSQYGLPKKIKFPLNRHDLNQRIWELDQATTTLRRISKTVSEEQPHVTLQPSSHEAAAFASAINKVRRHARHLYLAISTAYSTRCHAQHEARLILRNRSDLIRRYKSSKVTGTRALAFTVMLSPALSPSGDAPSYQTDITVADNDNSSDSTTQPYSKVIIRVPPSPRAPDPPRTAIENLCASIQQARDGNVILDLHLLAGKGLTHCHLASSSSEESVHLVAKRDDFVSLEVLLQETASKWLPGHRIVLSSIVASSILQLVSTPWLPLPLTSRSIWFTRTAVVSSNPSSAPQPFVEQSFENKNTSDAVSQSCNVRDYMLELGILLLEIEHWQTIDDYQAERLSQGQSDLSTRYDLARTWAKGSGSSILAPHHEAIERCIDCTFATSGATLDWDDGVLRKSFAELVVRPFQENVPRGLR
ncbi:hypothetical protein BJY04DRAFT_188016 [Aspergillus karnatakaensis]|uniref:uncharacterized protein n=1 Tax=Aspergillus karnatakaensis TaxID=1810916 RepID=UPI003CCCC7B6